jgi:hypothetical protein
MLNACIFQRASKAYAPMLDVTHDLHTAYARRYHMDFMPVRMTDEHRAWYLWHMARLLLGEYEYVFLIDADAAIVDDVDLRNAIVDKPMAAMWGGIAGEPKHFNMGVVYLQRDPATLAFIDHLLTYEPHIDVMTTDAWHSEGGRIVGDQWRCNELLRDNYADHITALGPHWNSIFRYSQVLEPVVMAWHSVMPLTERTAQMQRTKDNDWHW